MKVLISFFLFLFISCSLKNYMMMNEIHILPDGFKGIVVIIFDQKNGVDLNYEKGNVVYNIPQNGILKVKGSFSSGAREVKYYYKNDSISNEIKYVWDNKNLSDDTISVFGGSSGTYGLAPNQVDCVTYLVGNKKDADSLFKIENDIQPLKLISNNK